ncbi:Crp/Fnr family transcriptional regulator [Enterococcus saccharolyticus]|uniref:Crp/Fnr family transcriptional regulator n=1 Tax=Candidatus Enterococcus willemsii TaxID=1857215 RepID=A0ABQ6Z1W6_9ENTE|nr:MULTISPECIES: Crp/Fnr family transcriptional regulator [Enterococcus]KAF1305027.1 Crp/Fnr family transcriptional regulator [Enterococcus sp. CU12B]MCD5003666.1 Crp/Fnr family transcriptional regulator [Enterococcus saccharolyticus]
MTLSTCSHTSALASNCISLVPIFNHLTAEQMAEVAQVTFHKRYRKGEYLYSPEETSDSLYIVNQGLVRIYQLTESGKEQLFRFLKPGDFTGEMTLFQTTVHESFAQAMKDTSICILNRQSLLDLLTKYPAISFKIMEEFAQRLKQTEKQTTLVSTEKVETRLALFLVELVEHENQEVELPMSKKDLASYLGTTPETLSRTLRLFENQGLIKKLSNKRILIQDFENLLFL